MNSTIKNLSTLWLVTLVIKLVLSALLPLSSDEAYYWMWSHNLQLSYFDHPPMVSWLFALGHFLENFGHAVRWPAVILGHMIPVVWYFILKPHFEIEKIKWWFWIITLSPMLGFGSLIITPDLPVLFFWSLSILFLQRLLQTQRLSDYLWLGLSLGLGFCAKYHIVIFVPLVFLYLTFAKKWSRVIYKFIPGTILIGLIFCLPVLIWNYQNEWMSFVFQMNHGLNKGDWDPLWTLTYPLGQIVVLSPILFYYMIPYKQSTRPNLIFMIFGWGPLVFFLLTSFRALVEINWPIIGYPALFTIALYKIRSFKPILIANGLWLLFYVYFLFHIISGTTHQLPEKLQEPFLYKNLATRVEQYQPAYASSYQMASSLWYINKFPVYKLYDMSRFDFYDTHPLSKPSADTFYVFAHPKANLPDWVKKDGYQHSVVEEVDSFTIYKVSR